MIAYGCTLELWMTNSLKTLGLATAAKFYVLCMQPLRICAFTFNFFQGSSLGIIKKKF